MGKLFTTSQKKILAGLLLDRYGSHLEEESIRVDGRSEPGFVELTAVIRKDDGTSRYEMTIRSQLAENGISATEGGRLVTDFLDHYLGQYFESNRELLLPLDFQPHTFAEHQVFARGDISNPRLDTMADEIIETGIRLESDDPRHSSR